MGEAEEKAEKLAAAKKKVALLIYPSRALTKS
jgi:hypothetical protein